VTSNETDFSHTVDEKAKPSERVDVDISQEEVNVLEVEHQCP